MNDRILIVKTGTALDVLTDRSDDFEEWIATGLGVDVEVRRVDEGASLPPHTAPAGVVVTGSSAMVSHRLPWSERTAAWLVGAVSAGVPVLGICYGHQLLAHALGGRVGPNPNGREVGTVMIRRTGEAADDPLFSGMAEEIVVQATHVESVLALPSGATILASSAKDPHMAFRIAGHDAWGVQFHPEFSADVSVAYLEHRRGALAAEGLDVDALIAGVADSPFGGVVLRRFAERVASRVAV